MVHKKYTYKDGKRFGPYYYETKRIGNKIITSYLGNKNPEENSSLTEPNKKLNFRNLFLIASPVLVLFLILFTFLSINPTGHVSLDIKTNYVLGEPIEGEFVLNLKEGEFIPADAEVVISYFNQTQRATLSSLVFSKPIAGKFYAKDTEISGTGLGYGVIGVSEIYPELNFKLKIIRELEDSESESSEELTEETESSESENNGNSENNNENSGNQNSNSQDDENVENSQSSLGITGSVIQEDFEISATVSKNTEYSYEIHNGDIVELVSASVNYDGEILDDDIISLRIEDGVAYVTTDYSLTEEGYGEKFLGDYSDSINIDLSQFGISADYEAPIYIELIYNNVQIVYVSEDITVSGDVSEEIVSNLTEIILVNVSEVLVNTTQFGAVIGQPVKWVKTIALEFNSSKKVFIQIPQSAENIVIDILNATEYAEIAEIDESDFPSSDVVSENTGFEIFEEESSSESVTKETETDESANENNLDNAFDDEVEITVGLTGAVISGHISADISLNKESIISKFFKKIFRFTGNAVEGDESVVQEISVNLTSQEYGIEIEYTTQAPVAYEEDLKYEKNILVSGSEEVHYENVLVYTTFSDDLGVNDISDVRVTWIENNSLITFNNLTDTNGDGNYDYLSWTAPQLSNQTFNIILVVKAKHLDSQYNEIANVYSEVVSLDGNWTNEINDTQFVRVTFEKKLTNVNDITIYANVTYGSPIINVYEKNENVTLAVFDNITNSEYESIFLTNLSGEQKTFDLQIVNGSLMFDYIVDPTYNISQVFSPDIDMSPVDNETFAVIYTDASCDCVKFTVQNTNGSVRLAPVTVASGLNVNVSRVGISTVNSTSFFLGWTDAVNGLDRRTGYTITGTTYFAAASGDGAIGVANHDISLAMFGGTDPKVAYCYVDNIEANADLRVYNASSGALIGAEVDLNTDMAPETNLNNLIDCAVSGNTNGTAIEYDAGLDDDATIHMFNEAPLETIGDTDIDTSVGDRAQVEVTSLNNERFLYSFYDSETNFIRIASRSFNNTIWFAAFNIHALVGNNSRLALTTVAQRASGGMDRAVLVWYNGTGNYTALTVFDENGSRVLNSRQISDRDTNLRLVSVLGQSDSQNLSICPGKFVVAYTNASNTTVFGTYNLDGSNWDGRCEVVTPLANITTPFNNSGVRYSSNILNFTVDDPINNTMYVRVFAGTEQNTTNYDMMLYYSNVTDPSNVTYNWTSMPANRSDPNIFLLYRFDGNEMFGEINDTIVNDFSTSNLDGYISAPNPRFPGYFGKALASHIAGSSITLVDNSLLNSPTTSGNFSAMFWINITNANFSVGFPQIAVKQVDTANRDYGIYLRNSSKTIFVSFGNGAIQGTIEASNNTFAVRNSLWYHVVVTFNKATDNATIYINGKVNNSQNIGLSGRGLVDTAGSLTIGDFRGLHANLTYLDDLALFNRTLTDAEVLRYYQLGNGTYYWKVNVTNDDSGQNETPVYKFSVDSHNPHNVSLIYPNDASSFVNGTVVSFNWSAEDYVDLNMNCNLTVSNVASITFINITNATMYNRTLDTTSWPQTSHIWNVTCWDDAYNFNTSISRTVTIYNLNPDNSAPVVLLKDPANYSNTTGNVLTFKADFTDNVNVSNATLYIWNTSNGVADKIIGTNFTGLGNSSISANISYALNYSGVFYWNFLAFDNAAIPNSAFNKTNWTVLSNAVTGCQVLDRHSVVYYQVNNIVPSNDSTNSVPSACINITASNITYNGNGFNIYNTTFRNKGIYVGNNRTHDVSNVTLNNVNVTVSIGSILGKGIEFNRVNDSIIRGSVSAFSFTPLSFILSNKNNIIHLNVSNATGDGINLVTGNRYNNFTNIISNNNSGDGIEDAFSGGFNQWLNIDTNYNLRNGFSISSGFGTLKSIISKHNGIYGVYVAGTGSNLTNVLTTNNSNGGGLFIAGSYNNITNVTSNSNLYGIHADAGGVGGNIIDKIYLHRNTYGIATLGSDNMFSNGIINDSQINSFYSEASEAPNRDILNITLRRINFTEANASVVSLRLTIQDFGSDINETNIIDSYVGNYTFTNRGGTIFVENSNYLGGSIRFLQAVNGSGGNFSNHIVIVNNNASVRTDLNIGLNKSANITLKVVSDVQNPVLFRDNVACSLSNPTICILETPLQDNVRFRVNGFSEYSIRSDPAPIVLLKDPVNYSITTGNVLTFKADFIDNTNVSNATLYIWNTSNGVADKIIGTNFTGLGNSSISANISYALNYSGVFYWNFLAFDNAAIPNSAFNKTNWTIRMNVPAFNNTIIVMNSSLGANRSNENLTVSTFVVDPEGSQINVTFLWHNGTILHRIRNYVFLPNLPNNTIFNDTILDTNTTKGHNWTVGLIFWDGVQNSSEINSTFLTVRNGLPEARPGLPRTGNSTIDRTPYFNWTLYEPDGDTVSFALNISSISGASTCVDENYLGRYNQFIWEQGTRIELVDFDPQLKCFFDDGNFQYNWSIRANDTEENGLWGVHQNFTLKALLSINLTNASVQFGSLTQFGYNDTDDEKPNPLVVQNDGNSFVNVTISGTNLWQSVSAPSKYFALKIANVTYNGENASFRQVNSVMTYFNFDPDSGVPWIELLNYSDDSDTAEININVTVPPEEGAGSRGAIMTVTASFCPDY